MGQNIFSILVKVSSSDPYLYKKGFPVQYHTAESKKNVILELVSKNAKCSPLFVE